MEIETYEALKLEGIRHGFSTRSTNPLTELTAELRASFTRVGYDLERSAQPEQVHGAGIASVSEPQAQPVPQVDALATNRPGLTLVIRVADCGPVFFYDSKRKVIALAHSGRRGTEGNIASATLAFLQARYGSHPEDVRVHLGPCIRPPHYEVDFAAQIGQQARQAGVQFFSDDQLCTASHLKRYYSYRAEKGQTGRMWAALVLLDS